MSILYRVTCFAAALLSFNHAAIASPMPEVSRDLGNTLFPRLDTSYIGYSADEKKKLVTGFADAAALANHAITMDPSSTAFTHYLRPQDQHQAQSLWRAVVQNHDPSTAPYHFSVECATDADSECKSSSSLAITNARPQDGQISRVMKICPLFWKADETKRLLDSKKYDGDKRGSWCQAGQHFKAFETAGHTLLHEMTHLDALCASAGLPTRRDHTGFTSHGTDDVGGFGADYVSAARTLLETWTHHPGQLAQGALTPPQNAENIAAAATEWWFIKSCGFTNIPL